MVSMSLLPKIIHLPIENGAMISNRAKLTRVVYSRRKKCA